MLNKVDFLNHIFPKRIFLVQKRKFEHHHRIQRMGISPGSKFHLKQTNLIFRTKFVQKEYLLSKAWRMNITIKWGIFELVYTPSFILIRQFCLFGTERVFPVQEWKFEHHHRIQYIWISLALTFKRKQTISIFQNKFHKKRYFRSKTEKMNITIEFFLSELV